MSGTSPRKQVNTSHTSLLVAQIEARTRISEIHVDDHSSNISGHQGALLHARWDNPGAHRSRRPEVRAPGTSAAGIDAIVLERLAQHTGQPRGLGVLVGTPAMFDQRVRLSWFGSVEPRDREPVRGDRRSPGVSPDDGAGAGVQEERGSVPTGYGRHLPAHRCVAAAGSRPRSPWWQRLAPGASSPGAHVAAPRHLSSPENTRTRADPRESRTNEEST